MTSVLDGPAEPADTTDAANEMTAPDGTIRPGWDGLHRAVEAMDLRQQRRLRREVARLLGAVTRKGVTLVPLSLYFNERGIAKIELALARGKKHHDKRETVRERDWQRDKARLLRDKG